MPQTRKDFPYDRKLPVAGRAKVGQPKAKVLKAQARRLASYEETKRSNAGGKLGLRISSGGFHKPGSNQR